MAVHLPFHGDSPDNAEVIISILDALEPSKAKQRNELFAKAYSAIVRTRPTSELGSSKSSAFIAMFHRLMTQIRVAI